MRVQRRCFAFVMAMALPAVPAIAGQGDGDLRLSEFVRETLASPSLAVPHRGEGAGRALDALLGGRTLPIPCASPLLMELWRQRDGLPYPAREALRLIATRPSLPHEGVYQTRDGRFAIH